jgi:hypothetical protein
MFILFAYGIASERSPQSAGQGVTAPQTSPQAFEVKNACDGKYFPINKPAPGSCCEQGKDIYQVIGQNGGLGHRVIGIACTREDTPGTFSTHCGEGTDLPCTFGPCGVEIDKTHPAWQNGKDTKIFRPSSSGECGYQVTINAVTTFFHPEKYTGQQPLYPSVTGTCPYTACATGGKPVTKVTVVTYIPPNSPTGASLGRVTSSPAGITVSGRARASGLFSGDVTLSAEPTSKHARAVFSGDCKKAGEYGEKAECVVKLAPDPKVTVTFECEKGFTCTRGKD